MQIGGKPDCKLYRANSGFFELESVTLRYYKIVDTSLCPNPEEFMANIMNKPYFWDEDTGMVYQLELVDERTMPGSASEEQVTRWTATWAEEMECKGQ